jgi:ATP-dependent Clp protease ATP-binding subunit ClpA
MELHTFRCHAVVTTLENSTLVGSILKFPEVSAFAANAAKLTRHLERVGRAALEDVAPVSVHCRLGTNEPEVRKVRIRLEPPVRGPCWSEPLDLQFHAVCWNHGTAALVAFVPELAIEVIVQDAETWEEQVREHILAALQRSKAIGSLRELFWLQRGETTNVEEIAISATVKTPKEIARSGSEPEEKSVLGEVAVELSRNPCPEAYQMEDVVLRTAEYLQGQNRQSVLLVGPSGVGKTMAVYELVRQRHALQLDRTSFWSTSGARLVAGMTGFGAWQERCQALCREAAKMKAVIHFGNLMELMQVGKYVGNDQGVGDFLRPHIARGELLAIVECTPEQRAVLEHEGRGMLDAFAEIEVAEPSQQASRTIFREYVRRRANGRIVDRAALDILDRLHRRYATYSAYPGRPLRFLENLLADQSRGRTLAAAEVTRAFSRETGLPQWLLEDEERLDLAGCRGWFAGRVIGQERAVDLVVNLLATVKAGLARPGRPIASLLFLGPTGVGKTEMAKALSQYLYQDVRRLIRIDMSEYADPWSVDRLLGIDSQTEGLLTAKVREQPFGVVLFDEFEKAHPRFFDLLLQVLGEGRLTDAAGRLADFRNMVLVMTSNLGAESFGRAAIGFGDADEAVAKAEEHFAREVERFLRPEMLNRIDRIVPFLPLDEATLRHITRRELGLVQNRDGLRYRDLELTLSDEVVDAIIRRGHDPRYGARPIKRAIDRHLLAPLAAAVNTYSSATPLRAAAGVEKGEIRVAAGPRRLEGKDAVRSDPTRVVLAGRVAQFRREAFAVRRSHALAALENEAYRLERIGKGRPRRNPVEDVRREERLSSLQGSIARADALVARCRALEDRVLMAFYAGEPWDRAEIEAECLQGEHDLQEFSIDLYAGELGAADAVTLVVYGRKTQWMATLAEAYEALGRAWKFQVRWYAIVPREKQPSPLSRAIPLGDRDSKDPKLREQANETSLEARPLYVSDSPGQPPEGTIGLAMRLAGRPARLLLETEEGLHEFQDAKGRQQCLVHASVHGIDAYRPPLRIDRKEGIGGQPVRRRYLATRQKVEDRQTNAIVHWRDDSLATEVRQLVEEHFSSRLRAWLLG